MEKVTLGRRGGKRKAKEIRPGEKVFKLEMFLE